MAKNTTNSHQLIFNEVKERLKDQLSSVDTLDTKAGITLAFVGAFLGGLVNSSWFVSLQFYFLLPVLLGLVLTTLFALRTVVAREYRKDPEPDALIKKYADKNENETVAQLIRNFEDSYKSNKEAILFKKKQLNNSLILLFLSIFFLAFAIFFSNNRVTVEQIK